MLIPVPLAIDEKMSRRLAWLNRIGAITVFRLNSGGGPPCRACSRIC